MIRMTLTDRRGTSLMEVLVSMLIMVIGITSVIALFPVGVLRVRQAVLDTRCTIVSQNARNLILAKQMQNDPALIRLDVNSSGTNARVLDDEQNNAFAWLVNTSSTEVTPAALPPMKRYLFGESNGFLSGPNEATTLAIFSYVPSTPNEVMSFPVLVDPWLYESAAQLSGVANPLRIPISDYYTKAAAPVDSPYYDIRIASLAEIHGAPLKPLVATAAAPLIRGIGAFDTPAPTGANLQKLDAYRRAYITRWFSSLADVGYSTTNPVVPANPLDTQAPAPTATQYLDFDYASPQTTTTIDRKYPYTWAYMIQRPMEVDPEGHFRNPPPPPGAGSRAVRRPNRSDLSNSRISVLCFYRRNLATPERAIKVVEGCIFNGSRRVTLSWPSLTARPEIKKGTWLCEASISRRTLPNAGGYTLQNNGNLESGFYPPNAAQLNTYRRSFNFFKVTDYDNPELVGGRVFQKVTIDRAPQGYPTTAALGDLRGTDGVSAAGALTYAAPNWPLVTNPVTNPSPTETIFYPILIFDGLLEVF